MESLLERGISLWPDHDPSGDLNANPRQAFRDQKPGSLVLQLMNDDCCMPIAQAGGVDENMDIGFLQIELILFKMVPFTAAP